MKTSDNICLSINDRITGKWNRRTYEVQRLLGEGANGKVYLVRNGITNYAMKIAHNPLELQSEVNALKALRQAGSGMSYFVEADDGYAKGQFFSYYVMKFVSGRNIASFLNLHGTEWFDIVARRLLERLHALHRVGYIFGDVKRAHIQVSRHGNVELVDFGGVTRKGKAVRQFTEMYDRGYWQAGSRKADEGYDLFAFAVLCIECMDPEKELSASLPVLPQQRTRSYLKHILKRCPIRGGEKQILCDIIDGKLTSSQEALQGWRRNMLEVTGRTGGQVVISFSWLVGTLVAISLVFAASVYWTMQ